MLRYIVLCHTLLHCVGLHYTMLRYLTLRYVKANFLKKQSSWLTCFSPQNNSDDWEPSQRLIRHKPWCSFQQQHKVKRCWDVTVVSFESGFIRRAGTLQSRSALYLLEAMVARWLPQCSPWPMPLYVKWRLLRMMLGSSGETSRHSWKTNTSFVGRDCSWEDTFWKHIELQATTKQVELKLLWRIRAASAVTSTSPWQPPSHTGTKLSFTSSSTNLRRCEESTCVPFPTKFAGAEWSWGKILFGISWSSPSSAREVAWKLQRSRDTRLRVSIIRSKLFHLCWPTGLLFFLSFHWMRRLVWGHWRICGETAQLFVPMAPSGVQMSNFRSE